MDRTYPTQRADRYHPPGFGLDPSGKKEKRKTSPGREKNSVGSAMDHQHNVAERKPRRKIRIRITRGNEEEYVRRGRLLYRLPKCFLNSVMYKKKKSFCLYTIPSLSSRLEC